MSTAARLHRSIVDAGVPIVGTSIDKVGDPASVKVFPPELQPAAQPVIDSFDWSDAAQAQWEAVQNVPAAAALLQSADPIAQGVRATVRAVVDLLNIRLRARGDDPILEPEILAALEAGFPAGISLPGPRQDG